jgi:E3 ubiquitin-protein ligase HUWE1
MKFVDAILSNNSTDDHCREFVAQDGLVPLLSILGLPNLPVDYPVTTAAQAVASVCKSILVSTGSMMIILKFEHLFLILCSLVNPLSSIFKAS